MTHKLFTIAAIPFGVYVYIHSVQPVFEKELELRTLQGEKERLKQTGETLRETVQDKEAIIRQLDRQMDQILDSNSALQEEVAVARIGIILGELLRAKQEIASEARRHRREGSHFGLRSFCMEYADVELTRLGEVEPGSAKDSRKRALKALRTFAQLELEPGESDPASLDRLYRFAEETIFNAGGSAVP